MSTLQMSNFPIDPSRSPFPAPQAANNNTSKSKNDLEAFLNGLQSKEFGAEMMKFLQDKYGDVPFQNIDKIMGVVAQAFAEYQNEGKTSKTTAAALKALLPTWKVDKFLSDVKEVASNFPQTQDYEEELGKFDDFIKEFPSPFATEKAIDISGSVRSMVTRGA